MAWDHTIQRKALVTAIVYWRHVQMIASEMYLLTLENATVSNTQYFNL
jgi:hypothetical protein